MKGFYGAFGGQFVAETLIPALDQLEVAFNQYKDDAEFRKELNGYLNRYVGRPTPIYHAVGLSQKYGVNILFKREDLLHTGAHKINNTIGQILLAKRMGKKRIIAETGAGQHGVATATVAALMQMECVVYMGEVDIKRQRPNVEKMGLLGTTVISVQEGDATLKDATSAALRDYVANVATTHYIVGSVVGPHPYPEIVAHFQRIIGDEVAEYYGNHKLPDLMVAPVGGGSNAIGLFKAFLDRDVALVGVEGGGFSDKIGEHAKTLGIGVPGILHGALSYLLQDKGQVSPVHSVSAGLDYPGVGPEHAYLKDSGRIEYHSVRDSEALFAFKECCALEGIIPALESSHAIAYVITHAKALKGKEVLINLSGRGDKDLDYVLELLKGEK